MLLSAAYETPIFAPVRVTLARHATWGKNVCHMNIMTTLGGRQVFGSGSSQIDLIDEVELGLPTKAYNAVAKVLNLTPAEQDRLLQNSPRTRARWKHRSRLDPATSDRLARLARILALATDVLASQAHAVEWLRESSDALGGRTPLEMMTTDVGTEKVTNMLYQMDHGVYA
jgi:putative toxin-antitoxin system antitoxin component (TIGR02293 family)